MKYFPTMCIDNFYSNPDDIRKFALDQSYKSSPDGAWPGKRTNFLHEINEELFHSFTQKIFSIYFDLNFPITWSVSSQFQIIEPYGDKSSSKNAGWIHLDDNCIFAGIIYLTPDAELNSGTSIYKKTNSLYKDLSYDEVNKTSMKSKLYTSKNIAEHEYKKHIDMQNLAFQETIKFSNIYNRIILFDGEEYHGATNLCGGKEPRLTQVFFVHEITSIIPMPLVRYKSSNFV